MRKRAAKKSTKKRVVVPKPLSPRDRAADLRLRRTYGISLAEYHLIFRHQQERCAICKRPVRTGKSRLAVDHCHTSGRVRGLLCWTCNRNIARFQDNAERLLAASQYLLQPPVVMVLGERFTAPGRVGTKKRAKLLLAMKQEAVAQGRKSK